MVLQPFHAPGAPGLEGWVFLLLDKRAWGASTRESKKPNKLLQELSFARIYLPIVDHRILLFMYLEGPETADKLLQQGSSFRGTDHAMLTR